MEQGISHLGDYFLRTRLTRDGNTLRLQQSQTPVQPNRQCVYIEARRRVVGRVHDRGRRRNDGQPGALPDPVDVTMSVHQHRAAGQGFEAADEPASVDQAVPMRSERAFAALGYSTT